MEGKFYMVVVVWVLLIFTTIVVDTIRDDCRHKWTVLERVTTESTAEVKQRTLKGQVKLFPEDFDKYTILTVTCDRCGKIKHYRDKN